MNIQCISRNNCHNLRGILQRNQHLILLYFLYLLKIEEVNIGILLYILLHNIFFGLQKNLLRLHIFYYYIHLGNCCIEFSNNISKYFYNKYHIFLGFHFHNNNQNYYKMEDNIYYFLHQQNNKVYHL